MSGDHSPSIDFDSALSTQHSALHVGLLTPDLSHAHGWAHHSLSLLEALHKAGVKLTVIAAKNSPDVEGFTVHKLLPNVTPADGNLLLNLAMVGPRVRALLRDCDVLHTTIEPYAPLAAWVVGQRPLFVTGHGSYVRLPQTRRWPVGALYAWAFRSGCMIAVSRYTAKVAQGVLAGLRTVVVNNGVNAARYEHLPPLETPITGKIVLSVGGVKARKGSLELVRALAVVRETVPDVQGVILGGTSAEPDYVARVRAEIEALGLQDCVHLLGHVPEETLLGWYGAADVFALPSVNVGTSFEGYGLVHLEASAAGLPVIGTTDCGAEDAIDDGVTGLLIPQNDIAARLPEAITVLLTDRERAARMGAAGREKARHQTWDHVAARTIEVYRGKY